MIEHGITTTKADYWVHLKPMQKAVFWYRVWSCRAYVALYKPAVTIAHSKDANATATGAGYLIPQTAYFVARAEIPACYVDHVPDWKLLTDREAGLRGQEIALSLIEHRQVHFPAAFVTPLNGKREQLAATDCQVRWMQRSRVEIKTERVQSANLYVQTHEAGHRVHIGGDGTHRSTEFPSLFDGAQDEQ